VHRVVQLKRKGRDQIRYKVYVGFAWVRLRAVAVWWAIRVIGLWWRASK
jgi:hypothetical protein